MPCYDLSHFGKYFKENMNAIGLPAPSDLFGTTTVAYANIKKLSEAVSLYGRQITVQEAWRGSYKLERLRLLGPLSAAYYTGAAIGSAAVATGRSLGCGTSIADAIWYAKENAIYDSWLEGELASNPQFLSPVK